MTVAIRNLVVALASVCALDMLTTYIILSNGGHEANSFMANIAGNAPIFAIVKIGFVLVVVIFAYLVYVFDAEFGKRFATAVIMTAVVMHIAAVMWNTYQIAWYFGVV
jgi:Domain of unknown function (DUF5658)